MQDKFLTTDRLRTSTSSGSRTPKQQFESDRGRILFSSPLRRMQSKAQVFSLESNASVRSRLTHSIEVAHVGRYIVHQVKALAADSGDQRLLQQTESIEPLVETACLLHDIGNPPFGHLGEKAIQTWFKHNSASLYSAATGNDLNPESGYAKDFENFDGNPQGVRIVVTLQGAPGKKGLNFTLAQLGALLKYPKLSTDENPDFRKIGVFTSESSDLKEAWSRMSIPWGCRHPLVYLMEAADDIAYCLSDIEDGIEKRVIREEDFFEFVGKSNISPVIRENVPEKGQYSVVPRYVQFRTNMINKLTGWVASQFVENIDSIEAGSAKPFFDKNRGDEYSSGLEQIKAFCRESLYSSREAEDIEIAGYNIVYGLLDSFSVLLKLKRDEFNKVIERSGGHDLERRVFSKLPESLIEHYKFSVAADESNEWFHRFQLIVDYISGMTDDYALKVHRLFHGIDVSVV